MKAVLAYWIIGCIIVGLAWGGFSRWCPNDKMPIDYVVGAVAIWPAVLVGAIAGPHRTLVCNTPTKEPMP